MNSRTTFQYGSGLALAAMVAISASSNGCSAAGAAQGCDGLDLHSEAQLSVHEWVTAVQDLDSTATRVEGDWLQVCNDINKDLGLDTSKTTASDACGVLKTYIANEKATLMITLNVQPGACQADLTVEGNCQAQCTASANCDVRASCTPGQLVVACNGTCDAECDVTAPSFQCMGTCEGKCTATAAVTCAGECTGSCSGTCNGNSSNAMCTGMCVGSCSGMCTGSCNVSAGAMCMGTCDGTCTFTNPQATCQGECHGNCSVTSSPPSCTGQLNCQAAANCQASCQAQASASLNCSPPQVSLAVTGDTKLWTAYNNHIDELAKALEESVALTKAVGNVLSQSYSTLSAIGDVGAAGATCIASEVQVAAHAEVSVTVSVSASATVEGQ